MSVQLPPPWVNQGVNRYLPGVYGVFWQILTAAHGDLKGDFQLTSYYRSAVKNRSVGGASDSQHQLGLAVDFVYPRKVAPIPIGRMRQWGLTVIDEGDHIHIQAYPAGLLRRWGIFQALGL